MRHEIGDYNGAYIIEHWLLTPSPLMGEGWDGGGTACYAASIYLVYLNGDLESDVSSLMSKVSIGVYHACSHVL